MRKSRDNFRKINGGRTHPTLVIESILQLGIKAAPDYFFRIILFVIGAFIGFHFTRMAKIIDNYISIQFRIAFRLYLFISWFIINDFRCFRAVICFQTSTSQLSKERLISP